VEGERVVADCYSQSRIEATYLVTPPIIESLPRSDHPLSSDEIIERLRVQHEAAIWRIPVEHYLFLAEKHTKEERFSEAASALLEAQKRGRRKNG
jgi:hypothetical protein